MDKSVPEQKEFYPKLSVSIGRKLLRFFIAGFSALLVAFATLLFMQFLVDGFDDSASNTLTRYISLPSLTIQRSEEEISRPIKPLTRPEIDVAEQSEADEEAPSADGSAMKIGGMPGLEGKIETEINLPGLGDPTNQDREKMQQIKEALTSDEAE